MLNEHVWCWVVIGHEKFRPTQLIQKYSSYCTTLLYFNPLLVPLGHVFWCTSHILPLMLISKSAVHFSPAILNYKIPNYFFSKKKKRLIIKSLRLNIYVLILAMELHIFFSLYKIFLSYVNHDPWYFQCSNIGKWIKN